VLSRRRRLHGRRAQSLVEFALIAPLMAFLVLGSADLARAFYYSVALTNAAREGARHGAYFDPFSSTNKYDNATSVLSAVQSEGSYLGIASLSQVAGCPGSAPYAPPYPSALFPTTANTGFVYICFNNTPGDTSSAPGRPIRVSVLYTFAPVTPVLWSFVGNSGNVQMATSAEFDVEGL
jgi:Flp pilus assembly protein TadG